MLKLIGLCVAMMLFTLTAFAAAPESSVLATISEIISKLPEYLNLALSLLSAVIAIALVIPGDQPEKALQGVVDFLKKFSKK
jgi:hypothetical protein